MASEDLFEFLKTKGIYGSNAAVDALLSVLSAIPPAEIASLCRQIEEKLPRGPSRPVTPFTFIGTLSHSGAPYPCFERDCRISRMDSMARFAALYADELIIPDVFGTLSEAFERTAEHQVDFDALYDLGTYIESLFVYQPLILRGLVTFADSKHYHLCTDCYARLIGETPSNYSKKLDRIRQYLRSRYFKEVKYTLIRKHGEYLIEEEGPEALIEHRRAYTRLGALPQALKKLSKKVPCKVTSKTAEDVGVNRRAIDTIVDDLIRQDYYANYQSVNCLTSRQIDFEVIKHESKFDDDHARALLVSNAFSHSLPVIESVSIEKIMNLRISEPTAFDRYRSSVSKGLSAGRKAAKKEVDEIFSDEIRPEIDKINITIEKQKRMLGLSLKKNIAAAIGSLGITLCSGIIPPAFAHIAGGLGGAHYSSKIIRDVVKFTSEPPNILDNKYYFLWKVGRQTVLEKVRTLITRRRTK